MPKVTIAKYIRLSVEDAKYDSLSISNQKLLIERHIDTLIFPHGTEIEVVEFVEMIFSSLIQRHQTQSVIMYVEALDFMAFMGMYVLEGLENLHNCSKCH